VSGRFLDTNVLVYLAPADTAKADVAERLLAEGGTVNMQVLNELATVARRRMGLDWDEMADLMAAVRRFLAVEPLIIETHELGLVLAERHGLSIYDAMILAAGLLAGCDTLLSGGHAAWRRRGGGDDDREPVRGVKARAAATTLDAAYDCSAARIASSTCRRSAISSKRPSPGSALIAARAVCLGVGAGLLVSGRVAQAAGLGRWWVEEPPYACFRPRCSKIGMRQGSLGHPIASSASVNDLSIPNRPEYTPKNSTPLVVANTPSPGRSLTSWYTKIGAPDHPPLVLPSIRTNGTFA
jgi:predicted nucleic acid-binding protein